MKKIKLQVPDGKRVEGKEVNGLTIPVLIDEEVKDNRPVTERIKTFEDACKELGDEHPLVTQYRDTSAAFKGDAMSEDLIVYLKLRIITAALNEGWEPQFTEDEYRYFPWFWLYTKEEYDQMDDEKKGRCVLRSGNYTNAHYGFVYVSASYDASFSFTIYGARLAFRTRELAAYAGRQFIEEWADFVFKPRTGEELSKKAGATNPNGQSNE